MAECRVRKLHILAEKKTLVPRTAFVLEDALRTASFPGIPKNGKVIIKRLDLGKKLSTISSRVLSLQIDDLLRNIHPIQITDFAIEQPFASAVWFADDLEPYRLLAVLLSQNNRPLSWYWPVAIKGWSKNLTVNKTFELIINQALQKPAGLKGLSHVLKPLLKNNLFINLLNSIEPRKVGHWLLNSALKPYPDKQVLEKCDTIFLERSTFSFLINEWREILCRSVNTWPLNDSRVLFAAYLSLADINRHVTSAQATRLLHEIVQIAVIDSKKAKQGSKEATFGDRSKAVAVESTNSERKNQLLEKRSSKVGGRLRQAVETEKSGKIAIEESGVATEASEKNITKANGRRQKQEQENQLKDDGISPARTNPVSEVERKDEKEDSKYIQPGTNKKNKDSYHNEFLLDENHPLSIGFVGELSYFAGLLFLVPIIKRLGFETLLADYPEYYELQFAERVFWRTASLLCIPINDPIMQFLGEKPAPVKQQIEFVAPLHWRTLLSTSETETVNLRLCRVAGMPGSRLIMDNQGRLVIALWNPDNRNQINQWLKTASIKICLQESIIWSVEKAVDNFVAAICYYIRRYAKMNLRSLVKWTAHVAVTKTHVDITAPLQQIDIRVRLAGLDIDPGWVEWLGRVIQIHYVEDESWL